MVLIEVACLVISVEFFMKYLAAVLGFLYDNITHSYKAKYMELSTEFEGLKKQQNSVNIQDEFAKHARFQRQLNKIEDDLKAMKKDRNLTTTKWKWTMQIVLYVVYALIMFCILYFKREEPVIILPESWFPRLHRLLMFPTTVNGSIGLPPWMFICRQFSRAMLQ